MEYSTVAFVFVLFYIIWRTFRKTIRIQASDSAIFISGCDTGLGNRMAVYFDSLGCDVFAGCLDPLSSRENLPETVTIVPLNICKEDSVREAVLLVEKKLKEKKKNLWAIINNAGVCVYGQFEWQTWNQIQKQVDVNLLGTMRMTKAFLPLLRKNRGRIITITSVNGSIAYPGLAVYSATKFALEGLNHAIRLELQQQHGIKVIIVEPGDFARLTSIMSQHEKNAMEMWDNMTKQDQEMYGDFFHMYHRVTLKNYGLTSPRSLDDSPLLKDMEDALFSSSPQIKYISAGIQYRLFYRFLALMPYWFVDMFLNKVTEMLYKSDKGSLS